jgi:phage regulator Rha-like protein
LNSLPGSLVEFKLYLIKEFQRLKDEERKQLGWDIRRNLAKINERIHTDAIKENLILKRTQHIADQPGVRIRSRSPQHGALRLHRKRMARQQPG